MFVHVCCTLICLYLLMSSSYTPRWGQSAGAISVGLHLVTNGGDPEGLFRGAFMQSGSPQPTGDITEGQSTYDFLVAETGCAGAQDTLQCLRAAPYATLKAAIDKTPGFFSYQVSVCAPFRVSSSS